MKHEAKAIQHLEVLISIGFGKAHDKRFPSRKGGLIERNTAELVSWHCKILDSLGIAWSVQNQALQFINEGNEPETWNCFYKNSFKKLAEKILNGSTHAELIK